MPPTLDRIAVKPVSDFGFKLSTQSTFSNLHNTILFRKNLVTPNSANFYGFRIDIRLPENLEKYSHCSIKLLFSDFLNANKEESSFFSGMPQISENTLTLDFPSEPVVFKSESEMHSLFGELSCKLSKKSEKGRVYCVTTEITLKQHFRDLATYRIFSEVLMIGLNSDNRPNSLRGDSAKFSNLTDTLHSICQKETIIMNDVKENITEPEEASSFQPLTANNFAYSPYSIEPEGPAIPSNKRIFEVMEPSDFQVYRKRKKLNPLG